MSTMLDNGEYGDREVIRWLKRIDDGQRHLDKRMDNLDAMFITRTEHALYKEAQRERIKEVRSRMKSTEDDIKWVRRTLAAAFIGILAQAAIILFTMGVPA